VEYEQSGSKVDRLGDIDPSYFELTAIYLYQCLNNNRFYKPRNSLATGFLDFAGFGFRGGEQLTDLIVVVGGLIVSPTAVLQHQPTRDDFFGDFLAGLTIFVWAVMAFLLFLARSVAPATRGGPPEQSQDLPWVLINDQFPNRSKTTYLRDWFVLTLYNVCIAALTMVSIYTLVGHTYGAGNRVFGTLLAIRMIYMMLACIEDWTQVGTVHGFHMGLPRQLMATRAVFAMPVVVWATTGLILTSTPWW
jgi:hypothetical protein